MIKEPYGIIYLVTCMVTGEMYVGQTIRSLKTRWDRHCDKENLKSKSRLGRLIKKHKKKRFWVDQIDSGYSEGDLNNKEVYWISVLNTLSPNGLNLTAGGRFAIWSNNRISAQETHGMYGTKIHGKWSDVKLRHKNQLCDKWLIFEGFYTDMAETYTEGMYLARLDSLLPYSKDNCKWVSKEQRKDHISKSCYIYVEVEGCRLTLKQVAGKYKIPYHVIQMRWGNNCSTEELIAPYKTKAERKIDRIKQLRVEKEFKLNNKQQLIRQPKNDLSGRQFGELRVVSFIHNSGRGCLWNCECSCGNTCIKRTAGLNSGESINCGCQPYRKLFKPGDKIKMLTVVKQIDPPAEDSPLFKKSMFRMRRGELVPRGAIWELTCECGNTFISCSDHLMNVNIVSCGCYNKALCIAKTKERAKARADKLLKEKDTIKAIIA